MTPQFADTIRSEAERESLDVRVIQSDVFTAMDGVRGGISADRGLRGGARLPHDGAAARAFRTLPPSCLAPGGRLVLNTFLPRQGYTPDDAARELGQQCNSMIFTRDEVTSAAAQLPLELVADDPAYEYEKAHLPEGAWPPTGWFDGWASGLDLFDVERDRIPDRVALAGLPQGGFCRRRGRHVMAEMESKPALAADGGATVAGGDGRRRQDGSRRGHHVVARTHNWPGSTRNIRPALRTNRFPAVGQYAAPQRRNGHAVWGFQQARAISGVDEMEPGLVQRAP